MGAAETTQPEVNDAPPPTSRECALACLVLLTSFVASGCQSGGSHSGPTGPLASPELAAGLAGEEGEAIPPGPTLDELFAEVATVESAFAGLYLDPDGMKTLLLVDTARAASATFAVRTRFAELELRRPGPYRIRQVRFSFLQLAGWRQLLYGSPLPLGITTVDIDEPENVLRVGVATPSALPGITEHLRTLGIPETGFAIEVAELPKRSAMFLSSPVRPTLGGLQIATSYSGCTMGFNAKKQGEFGNFLVINAHCTLQFGAVDGTVVGQPLLQSNYQLGIEHTDPPFTPGPGCPSGCACRHSDAALIKYDPGVSAGLYWIARTLHNYTGMDPTQSGSKELADEPFYTVGERSDASLLGGLWVSKVGASSGWTSGPIYSTCVDVIYAPSQVLRCQYFAYGVGRSGDSGSPVFTYDEPNLAWLAGIFWGDTVGPLGTAFVFSSINSVKLDLGTLTVSKPVF